MGLLRLTSFLILGSCFLLPKTFSVDWLSKARDDILKLRGSIHLNQKADILFLIDSSGSLWGPQFGYEMKFVRNLLNKISVGYEATRVEVIPFSNSASHFIRFISDPKSTKNKCYFNQRFSTLKQENGMTNMKDAFQKAFDVCLGKWQGIKRSPMKVFKTVIILLTDGYWNWPRHDNDPTPIAKKLIDQKAEIFAIGVGGGVHFQNLRKLVAGQKPGIEYAFHLKNFNQFNELATYIRGDPHQKQWETVDVDASMCGNQCDGQAKCACGLVKGDYKCACPAGMAGSGIRGDCKACPPGRYKEFEGHAEECTKCPDFSTHKKHGSKHHGDCECMPGYFGNPNNLTPCKPRDCAVLVDPLYGSIKGSCKTTLGSECSFECDEGYRLLGDATRQCIVNPKNNTLVTWSGTPVTCAAITCPSLRVDHAAEPNGYCSDKDGNKASSNIVNVTCNFNCSRGYRSSGDLSRTCRLDGKWSGTPTACTEVRCEKLPKVSIGFYTPKEFQCDEKAQKFDKECKHNCPHGYYMPPGTIYDTTNPRTCDYKTGTWTGEPRVCKDYQVPELNCSSNIQVPNDPGEKTASVYWNFTFDDNSLRAGAPGVTKEMFSVSLKINDKETSLDLPKLLEIGKNEIQYQVTDRDNNSEKCVFTVEVLDKEPPTCSFCPPSKELMVTKSTNFRLSWKRPNCTDNSGIPPETRPNIRMGSLVVAPGVYSIDYTVKDKALNTYVNCSFFIKLKVPECNAFIPPKNGLARCINYGNVLGCTVACRDTYDFVYKPASSYSCTNGKWDTWSPTNDHDPREQWPDCSKRANPSEAAIKALPQFYFKGDCNDPNVQEQLKQGFVTILSPPNAPPFFCLFNPQCNAQNVKIYCGETDASARRKRSANTRQVYFEVTYVEKSNQIQAGSDDFANQDKFKVFKQEVDKKRDEVYRSLQKVNWGAFNTKTGLDLGGTNNLNLKQTEGYCSEEGAVVRKCTKNQLQYYPKRCNFDKGDITKCIRCPVGTYYNSDKEDCNICPEGSFSPNEGALECKKCPLGTWTFGDKKENFTSCQAECGPGYFSNSGIAVCFQCPAGTYSSERRNKNCTVCPAGTTSVAAASTRLEDCGMKCAPGTFSSNGVEPCTPCPLGTYQHQLGQTTCLPCPGRLSTYGTGADTSSSCFEVNDCMSSPCQNNGKCIDTKESYRCECLAGFMGDRCQIDVDECAVNPCSLGATCLDKVNSYTCLCPEGYTGTKCDKMIETCKTKNPCVRGTCKEKGAGAECECPVGYEGQFCERNTDECALNPCLNNAVCIGGVDSFQCLCRKGFSGQLCQINDNDCKTNPCQNNGKCIDRNGFYICQCPAGYSGANCEHKINECQSEPCQNGGICTEKLNGYDCACQPTYIGVNCQHQLSSDFDLTFQDRVSLAYSKANQIIPDIREFTVALWLRTTDSNPGVPLSYAVKDGAIVQDNALALQDCSGLNLIINNKTVFTGIDINDGNWHHVAVTWQSGSGIWAAFLDGSRVSTASTPFQQSQVIRGGGVLMSGQEQDEIGGGFNAEECYIGDISQMNIWKRVLSDDEVYNLAQSCDHTRGDMVAWADFREYLSGVYTITPKSYACEFQNILRYTNVIYNASIPSHDNAVMSSTSPEACAASCDSHSSFLCRSFDFNTRTKKCYLSAKHSADNLVQRDASATFNYYELNCARSLGVTSKLTIPNSFMTASSSHNGLCAPHNGRLNKQPNNNANAQIESYGAWCAATNNNGQWLKVNFNVIKRVTAVATQGRYDADQWVTQYRLQYSMDGTTWSTYPQNFRGNTDRNTIVRHEVRMFNARYVRFQPISWHGHISMRVEIYGCSERKVKPADNVNECSSSPCLNGGVCVNRYSRYMCLCKQGFTGHRCDKAIPCGTLESPIYGVIHSSGSTHGSTATFTCRAGYRIKGTGTRSCQSGQWTGTQPTCEDIDECLTGGHGCNQLCINTPGSYTCACAPGYQHTSATQCSDIKECSMNNGGCSHSCHERPGAVTCSCPSGMKLLSGGRTCSDIDECSRGNGGCEHTCFNTLRSFKCLCNKGYRLNSNQRNCDELSCPALLPVADSTKKGNSNLVWTAVRYTCNNGFRIIGSSRRECQADLQWSGVQPRCERLYCREVGTVKNAVRSLVNYHNNRPVLGSIARFACNPHHVMQGSPDRVCQADGSWSGELPRCIPAFCSKLNPPSRGTVQGYRFELGATLRITCDKGYKLKPASSSFRTCVKTPSGGGTWSGQDPVCEIVDCGDVKPPYGGYRTLPGGTKYQAVVTYTCKPQHHLQGKPSHVCQADGTWSGSQPVCLERSCGYLDPPANGEKIGEGHQYGESVTFKCNTGYNLIGSSKLTCQTSGQWSHSVPSCQIVNCGDPGTPVNGVRFGNTFTYMSSVFLECNPGYKLVGAFERKCQVNGQWSNTQPKCVATSCGRLRVGPTGTITSPNYPSDYDNNEYCTWEIRVPVDKKVRLNFKDFKTELGKDLLMIYDTNQKTPTIYFDGTTNMPGPFTSSGNSLRLRFISDGQTAMKGFKVDYTQIDMNCGGTLLDPKGVITSPKYPNPYDNNLDCVWLIARPNDRIMMSLLEFDTEDHHDFLAISFGREVTKDLTYEWSGLGTSIKPFECLNYMWLRFKTNWITTGRVRKGFKVQYRGVNKNQIARKK